MNRFHRWYCRSQHWGRTVQERVIPWVTRDADLGDRILEIGPGPGRTTDRLREMAATVTCIEIDHDLADDLKRRLAGSNVTVVEADATNMPLPEAAFTGAVSFTMLHHVPTAELQDRLLSETFRILRPGGIFAGSDSTPNLLWNLAHLFDTRVPVDPDGLQARLQKAGFTEVLVKRRGDHFRWSARKPGGQSQSAA
jgi:SAM-dependent methyltransferase